MNPAGRILCKFISLDQALEIIAYPGLDVRGSSPFSDNTTDVLDRIGNLGVKRLHLVPFDVPNAMAVWVGSEPILQLAKAQVSPHIEINEGLILMGRGSVEDTMIEPSHLLEHEVWHIEYDARFPAFQLELIQLTVTLKRHLGPVMASNFGKALAHTYLWVYLWQEGYHAFVDLDLSDRPRLHAKWLTTLGDGVSEADFALEFIGALFELVLPWQILGDNIRAEQALMALKSIYVNTLGDSEGTRLIVDMACHFAERTVAALITDRGQLRQKDICRSVTPHCIDLNSAFIEHWPHLIKY